jgi:hypothetical protein
VPKVPTFRVPKIPTFRIPKIPTFRNPLTAKFKWTTWISWAAFILFTGICAWMLWGWVLPIEKGDSQLRLGADSSTYFALADDTQTGKSDSTGTLGGNSLGMIAIALLLKRASAIALFNFALFVISFWCVKTIRGADPYIFGLLLMLNAETAVSIVTLNKEIFIIISVVLLAKYIYSEKRSKLLLLLILGISLMARWEQAFVILMFVVLRNGWLKRHPWICVSLVVGGISLIYPLLARGVDLSGFTDQASGGGAIALLDALQSHGGFFLAVVPKIIMSVAGRVITPLYFFGAYSALDPNDLQNRFVVHLHSVALVALFGWALFKGKLSLKEPIPLFIALYLIVTAVNPFIQPRYEYPVYVLLCLQVAITTKPRARVAKSITEMQASEEAIAT